MTAWRRLQLLCGVVLLASCASEAGVVSTRSVSLPAPFDREVQLAEVTDLPDIDAVEWGDCDDQDAPWECGSIEVPLDYRRPLDMGTVTIAVSRLPATDPDARIGSLVLNPGGPGGSGVDLAWGYAPLFPTEIWSASTSSASTRAASAGRVRSIAAT
jgi:hypothetical protein